jgi:hypothetical protein
LNTVSIKINLVPKTLEGLNYLLRFFGSISCVLNNPNNQIAIKAEILSTFETFAKAFIEKLLHYFTIATADEIMEIEDKVYLDLMSSFSVFTSGMYFIIINFRLNSTLKILLVYFTDLMVVFEAGVGEAQVNNVKMSGSIIIQLKYLIYLCTSIISYNRRVILEKDFLSKQLEVDTSTININMEIDNNNEALYSEILICTFKVMDLYLNLIKLENFSGLNALKDSIFYFLKYFCKVFLSRRLSKDFYRIFKYMSEKLASGTDESVIVGFVINFIVALWVQKSSTADRINLSLSDIFEIFVENCYMAIDQDSHQKVTYVGKIALSDKGLKDIIGLHSTIISLDPLLEGKQRKLFYHGLTRIVLLESNNDKDIIFDNLVNFYIEKLNTPLEIMLDINSIIGYIKDFIGIVSAVTQATEYNKLLLSLNVNTLIQIDKLLKFYCTNTNFVVTVLKFYRELTHNKLSRIGYNTKGN